MWLTNGEPALCMLRKTPEFRSVPLSYVKGCDPTSQGIFKQTFENDESVDNKPTVSSSKSASVFSTVENTIGSKRAPWVSDSEPWISVTELKTSDIYDQNPSLFAFKDNHHDITTENNTAQILQNDEQHRSKPRSILRKKIAKQRESEWTVSRSPISEPSTSNQPSSITTFGTSRSQYMPTNQDKKIALGDANRILNEAEIRPIYENKQTAIWNFTHRFDSKPIFILT